MDSGSIDRTCDIAAEMGASVHRNPFESFGQQRNWAIEQIDHRYEWVFHLDADERFTAELVAEMAEILGKDPGDAGFFVPHKLMFMGRWLRHAEGGYPIYQMRLFHKGRMRFADYGHGQRELTDGSIGMLQRPYLHFNFSKGLEDWIDKHNRYSTLEARELFAERTLPRRKSHSAFGNAVERRRFLKSTVYPLVPGSWLGRFVWMYLIRLGFLDGKAGLQYCLLMSAYDLFTSLKLSELKRQASGHREATDTSPLLPEVGDTLASGRFAATATHNGKAYFPMTTGQRGGVNQSRSDAPAPNASAPDAVIRKESSPWPIRLKLGRVAWMAVRATLFRWSFHNWYAWRRILLRLFGAKIGREVRIRPTVRVEIPWKLTIAERSTVGDFAILYSLGTIAIGHDSTISQYAHLCAGTHDYSRPDFPLICPPINIGSDVWVAADAFVGPGVTVGDRAIVGARTTVIRDVPPGTVVGGNPARKIKDRSDGPRR